MSLCFSDGRQFSRGSCPYDHRPATDQEMSPRIMIQVEISGLSTYAMVDTGGVYLICHPEFANLLDLHDADALEEQTLLIPRYGQVKGTLYRIPLKLLAAEGNSHKIMVTAFVPQPTGGYAPPFPPVMGLQCCLERLRFAVDPYDDTFYFGTIDEESPL